MEEVMKRLMVEHARQKAPEGLQEAMNQVYSSYDEQLSTIDKAIDGLIGSCGEMRNKPVSFNRISVTAKMQKPLRNMNCTGSTHCIVDHETCVDDETNINVCVISKYGLRRS